MAIFFAKLSANTGPLFLVDLIFPCIRRLDMFVKPTRLIGKKEKGIEKRKNEEKRKRAEKSEKEAKNRKQTGLYDQKKWKKKKKTLFFWFIDRCLVGRPIMIPISGQLQNYI